MRRHVRRMPVVLTAVLSVLAMATTTASAVSIPVGVHRSVSCGPHCPPLEAAGLSLVAADGGPPGLLVLVDRRGTVVTHSFGSADVTTAGPITTGDHLRLASVSKAFSGAAALALVARGTLHLSDTVGHWLPDVPDTWRHVTLRELLQHTSGIFDFSQTQGFVDAIIASFQVPPAPDVLPTYAYRAGPDGNGLAFAPPGSDYRYSNTDNILVGLMIQAATHHPYAEELQSLVFGPLGLHRTALPTGSALPAPFAHGYAVGAGEAPTDVTEQFAAGWSWASGGIVSTPSDTDRFVRAYVRGATTDPSVRAEQFRFRPGSSEPPGPGTNSAGLAIFRYATRCGTVYGHTGNTAGYTQFAAATADGSRSVVVQVNGQISEKTDPATFAQLREVETLATCAALAR